MWSRVSFILFFLTKCVLFYLTHIRESSAFPHEWQKDSYMACLCMLEHLDGRISLPFEWDAESTKNHSLGIKEVKRIFQLRLGIDSPVVYLSQKYQVAVGEFKVVCFSIYEKKFICVFYFLLKNNWNSIFMIDFVFQCGGFYKLQFFNLIIRIGYKYCSLCTVAFPKIFCSFLVL